MSRKAQTHDQLRAENEELRARLEEAEDTLRAIRNGEVDALVVSGASGEQIFTLQGAEHIYRLLIEDMREGALILAEDGMILYCNHHLAMILKVPLEEVISSSIFTWIAPEHQAQFRELMNSCAHGEYCLDLVFTASDGVPVPVYLSANKRSMANMADHIFLVVSDISERSRIGSELELAKTEAEEALQLERLVTSAIVDSSDDAIIGKSLDGIVMSWNQGAQKMFGYSAEEMLGQPVIRLFPLERQQEERDVLAAVLRGETAHHFETVRICKDGRRIDVSVSVAPIRDRQGRIIGASKIARDITERKRIEVDLLETKAILQAAMDRSPAGIAIADAPSGSLRYVNEAGLLIRGGSRDSVVKGVDTNTYVETLLSG